MAKILIVDDLEVIHRLIRRKLRHHSLAHAYNWQTTQLFIAQCVFDVVLLDLQLPGVHGLDILHRLKQAAVSAKIVMLSAELTACDKARAFALGAEAFWQKSPACFSNLERQIEVLLGSPETR